MMIACALRAPTRSIARAVVVVNSSMFAGCRPADFDAIEATISA